jgi:hypothetical protein
VLAPDQLAAAAEAPAAEADFREHRNGKGRSAFLLLDVIPKLVPVGFN